MPFGIKFNLQTGFCLLHKFSHHLIVCVCQLQSFLRSFCTVFRARLRRDLQTLRLWLPPCSTEKGLHCASGRESFQGSSSFRCVPCSLPTFWELPLRPMCQSFRLLVQHTCCILPCKCCKKAMPMRLAPTSGNRISFRGLSFSCQT